MKKLLLACVLMAFAAFSHATPTETIDKAVNDILTIAKAKDVPAAERKVQLEAVIQDYVDLQAASQRVLATHWKKASKEQKIAFMKTFRKVLTNTYFNLLEQYTNEEVRFTGEKIKKQKYAEVESVVVSGGKEIPVTYRLLQRKGEWKVYDFVAEGISMIRSFSSDYQSVLRSQGIDALNEQLAEKVTF